MTNAPGDYFDAVIADVAAALRTDARAIDGRSRRKSVSIARHVVWWICRRLPESPSYPEIGARFHRDHTTIMVGVRHVDALVQTDARLAERLRALEARLCA